MKKSELLEKLKEFKAKLEEHKDLYDQSFIEDEHLGVDDYPDRNIEELESQRKELHRQFYVLEKFINEYSMGRIIQHARGWEWDIYREAIGNNGPPIKDPCLDSAIMDLEGIIAKIEAEDKEEIDIIEDKDIMKEPKDREKKIKAFLSYSSKDKELAGKVKFSLEDYGLEAFLAHEDIEPSAEWVDTILAELESCNIFIAIITENFYESDWTDQEIGIAFAYNKKIMPIKLSVDPKGFISRYQALRMDINNIKASCYELVKVIASDAEFANIFRDALIKKFGDSNSYANSAHNTELLLSIEGFNIDQVTDIIKHTINNIQINDCFKARNKLRNFVHDYKDQIGPELLEAFDEAIKPGI